MRNLEQDMTAIDVIGRIIIATYWFALVIGGAENVVALARRRSRSAVVAALLLRAGSVGCLVLVAMTANDDCGAASVLASSVAGLLVFLACVFDASRLVDIRTEQTPAA